MVYKDVCLSSSYSDLYQSLNASLQPNQYGCLGTYLLRFYENLKPSSRIVNEYNICLFCIIDTSGVQCELFTATRCILDFNFDRIEHLQSTGWPSTNTTALCGYEEGLMVLAIFRLYSPLLKEGLFIKIEQCLNFKA